MPRVMNQAEVAEEHPRVTLGLVERNGEDQEPQGSCQAGPTALACDPSLFTLLSPSQGGDPEGLPRGQQSYQEPSAVQSDLSGWFLHTQLYQPPTPAPWGLMYWEVVPGIPPTHRGSTIWGSPHPPCTPLQSSVRTLPSIQCLCVPCHLAG